MRELGWVEELGSGITNVTRYLPHYSKDAKPSFIEGSMFTTIIPLPNIVDNKVRDKMRDKMRDKVRDKILDLIKENPHITIPQIADKFEKTQSWSEKQIKKLRDEDIIERKGSRKTGQWIIKADIDANSDHI